MGCHALQGIIPIEGSNPGLLHYRQILYHLSLQGVGNLFFLQGIIPTHELDRGLLHCRQILYQLSYQGGPRKTTVLPQVGLRTQAFFIFTHL